MVPLFGAPGERGILARIADERGVAKKLGHCPRPSREGRVSLFGSATGYLGANPARSVQNGDSKDWISNRTSGGISPRNNNPFGSRPRPRRGQEVKNAGGKGLKRDDPGNAETVAVGAVGCVVAAAGRGAKVLWVAVPRTAAKNAEGAIAARPS